MFVKFTDETAKFSVNTPKRRRQKPVPTMYSKPAAPSARSPILSAFVIDRASGTLVEKASPTGTSGALASSFPHWACSPPQVPSQVPMSGVFLLQPMSSQVLIGAVQAGDSLAVAESLLDPACIAMIDVPDGTGFSALDYAIEWQRFPIAEMLIERGAKIAERHLGSARLMLELMAFGALSLAKTIAGQRRDALQAGSLLRVEESHDGEVPLHHAIRYADAALIGLLADRSSVGLQDHSGCTAFHWAISCGDLAKLGLLLGVLDASSDDHLILDAQRDDGCTALMLAVDAASDAATAALLRAGASADMRDRCGNSALHRAAARGSVPIVLILLSAGARTSLKNHDGCTPLALARLQGAAEVGAVLESFGAIG